MTRKTLFDITESNHLTLACERATTGPDNGPAFREFEFTGTAENLIAARKSIREGWTHSPDFVTTRNSDIDGELYLLVTSFWCEPSHDSHLKIFGIRG